MMYLSSDSVVPALAKTPKIHSKNGANGLKAITQTQ